MPPLPPRPAGQGDDEAAPTRRRGGLRGLEARGAGGAQSRPLFTLGRRPPGRTRLAAAASGRPPSLPPPSPACSPTPARPLRPRSRARPPSAGRGASRSAGGGRAPRGGGGRAPRQARVRGGGSRAASEPGTQYICISFSLSFKNFLVETKKRSEGRGLNLAPQESGAADQEVGASGRPLGPLLAGAKGSGAKGPTSSYPN